MRDKLKFELFDACLCEFDKYKRYQNQFGEFNRLTSIAHARFAALLDVIEEAGLYSQYRDWMEAQ